MVDHFVCGASPRWVPAAATVASFPGLVRRAALGRLALVPIASDPAVHKDGRRGRLVPIRSVAMRGLAAAVVGLAVLASGCSTGDDPPSTLPPITATPSPTPTPVPTPTGINAATPEGANAFTRYWFAELNAAFTSRESARLRSMSSADCEFCNNFLVAIDNLRRDRQRVTGGTFQLFFVEAPPIEPDGVVLDIAYSRAASVRVDASDRPVASGAPNPKQLAQVKLVRAAGGWRFDALRLVKQ